VVTALGQETTTLALPGVTVTLMGAGGAAGEAVTGLGTAGGEAAETALVSGFVAVTVNAAGVSLASLSTTQEVAPVTVHDFEASPTKAAL
jgi:hypothetical protein